MTSTVRRSWKQSSGWAWRSRRDRGHGGGVGEDRFDQLHAGPRQRDAAAAIVCRGAGPCHARGLWQVPACPRPPGRRCTRRLEDRPRRLPARLPRHLRDARHGRGRRRRARPGRPRPSADPRRAVHQGRPLHRAHLPPRARCCIRCGASARKGSGRFEPVGWDEALDASPPGCSAIAARDPQAILPYSYAGTMGLVQGEAMAARFFHRLGASLLDRTICASAGGDGAAGHLRRQGRHARRVLRRQPADPDLGQQHASPRTCTSGRCAQAGQARAARSWSASTRAAPRPPTSATSTSRCCRAPTARWRWG